MFIAAAVAVATVIGLVGYNILGNTIPDQRSEVDLSQVTYDVLCNSLGGQWVSGDCLPSGTPPPTFGATTTTTPGTTTTTSHLIIPTAPGSPRNLVGTPFSPYGVSWAWDAPLNNGGRPVTAFDLQWRVAGTAWSGNIVRVVSYFHEVGGFSAGQGVDVRVRAVNSVGDGGWTIPHGTVDSSAMLGPSAVPQLVRFDADTTFTWPWPDMTSAVLVLAGGSGGGGGGGAGGGRGRDGTDATDGTGTTVTRGSTIYTSEGGIGGGGAQHGWNGSYSPSEGNTQRANGVPTVSAPFIGGLGGGGGGGSCNINNYCTYRGGRGGNGGIGVPVIVILTGMVVNERIVVTIGEAGSAGTGGARGGRVRTTSGRDGSVGPAGYAYLMPAF